MMPLTRSSGLFEIVPKGFSMAFLSMLIMAFGKEGSKMAVHCLLKGDSGRCASGYMAASMCFT